MKQLTGSGRPAGKLARELGLLDVRTRPSRADEATAKVLLEVSEPGSENDP
jgi:uncharacterized protein with von Willebrand factor type A (vWA) domain